MAGWLLCCLDSHPNSWSPLSVWTRGIFLLISIVTHTRFHKCLSDNSNPAHSFATRKKLRADIKRRDTLVAMRLSFGSLAVWAAACVSQVSGAGPTDSYIDADAMQSGYLPNHNMDPTVVDSSGFGILWTVPFNSKELVRASKP